jgi:hypothetical protein
MERDVIRQTPDQPGLLVLGNASLKVEDMKGVDRMQLHDGVTSTQGNIMPVAADHGACCLQGLCAYGCNVLSKKTQFTHMKLMLLVC